jgi:transposase
MNSGDQVVQKLVPDPLWERIAPLLPAGKPHPWGVCRERVDDRRALAGILFVLREGCRWEALDYTSIVSHSTAHRRFQEWQKAGVFQKLWQLALKDYDALKGIDWDWLALDGALTKAPLAGEKKRSQPDRSGEKRHETQPVDGRGGHSAGHRGGGCQPSGLQTASGNFRRLGDPTSATHPRDAAGVVSR